MSAKRSPKPKRATSRKLNAAEARRLFSYSKLTGIVRWRVRPNPRSRVFAGDRAGTVSVYKGHARRQITWRGRIYKEHRLIWLLVTGEWPKRNPDHRDGDACNNRWSNLRAATQSQNMMNQRLSARNVSGYKWVRTLRDYDRRRPYQAIVGGVALGNFACPRRAHEVAKAYARKLHGEFFTTRRAAGAVAQGARM